MRTHAEIGRHDGYRGCVDDPKTEGYEPPNLAHLTFYRWLSANDWRLDVARAAQELAIGPDEVWSSLGWAVGNGLLHPDEKSPGQYRAVDPHVVAAATTMPLERQIRAEQDRLNQIREQFCTLRDGYLDGTRRAAGAFQVIPDLDLVRVALNQASEGCREEMLTSQPGGNRAPEALQEALARDTLLLQRGIRMRTLYQHTARFNGPSQAYVATASALGAEYRTAHQLFGRLIMFDREVAFVPDHNGTWGAVAIREPSVVHYLYRIFERAWDEAQPYSEASTEGLEIVARDIDRTILRLLAAGVKDETIARRLGMSLRTVRKHIADIMEGFGAQSRFQAGVRAAAAGLLDEEERKPPGTTGGLAVAG